MPRDDKATDKTADKATDKANDKAAAAFEEAKTRDPNEGRPDDMVVRAVEDGRSSDVKGVPGARQTLEQQSADTAPTITTQLANQRVMGAVPDPAQPDWPIAPEPQDAGLVSPTGVPMRPAAHAAAFDNMAVRFGELREFLKTFDHHVVLAGHPEWHMLVSHLKSALRVPEAPLPPSVPDTPALPTGPGTGSVIDGRHS